MSELFKCLCFMEMLSLSTRDHNASAVDPGCFMVYNWLYATYFRSTASATTFTSCLATQRPQWLHLLPAPPGSPDNISDRREQNYLGQFNHSHRKKGQSIQPVRFKLCP